MIKTSIKTKPLKEPISIAEARDWLSVGKSFDSSVNEQLINDLITQSREQAESFTNRAFINTEFETYYSKCDFEKIYSCNLDYPDFTVPIPKRDLQEVKSIKYFDPDNTAYTIDSSDYFFDIYGITFQDLELNNDTRYNNAYYINYISGYGEETSDIQIAIKQGIKYILADNYSKFVNYRGLQKTVLKENLLKTAEDILIYYKVV